MSKHYIANRLDVVFENCEVVQVPFTDVRYISLGGITRHLWCSNICLRERERVSDLILAKSAYVIVVDKPEYERIKVSDNITHFDFMLEGTSLDYVGVKWKEGSGDYHNVGQRIEVVNGEIRIKINIDEEVG